MPYSCARGRALLRRRTLVSALSVSMLILAGGSTAVADDGPGGTSAPSGGSAGTPTRDAARRDVRLSRAVVRLVQRRLGVAEDGIVGPRTRRTLRRYQRANGIAASGRLTRETLRSLHVDRPTRSSTAAPATQGVEEILAAARNRIGASYRMGGTGPTAYDCSGLTVEAFASAGVGLARTSFDQYEQGVPVKRNAIRPGDLVFFDTAGSGASHVGIATRRNKIVSATTSRGVIEHRIDGAYWSSHYLGARRVAR